MILKYQNNRTSFGEAEYKRILLQFALAYLKIITHCRVSGCENCNVSANNEKYRVGFQPCDYKYFQKSALRYQIWPSFSRLIFNDNASFLEFEFRLRVHFK